LSVVVACGLALGVEDNHLRVAVDRIARRAEGDELRRALEPLSG